MEAFNELRRLSLKYIDNDAVHRRVQDLIATIEGITTELLEELEWEHSCTEVSNYRRALNNEEADD